MKKLMSITFGMVFVLLAGLFSYVAFGGEPLAAYAAMGLTGAFGFIPAKSATGKLLTGIVAPGFFFDNLQGIPEPSEDEISRAAQLLKSNGAAPMTRGQLVNVLKASSATTTASLLESMAGRGEKFLMARGASLDPDIRQAIAQKDAQWALRDYYVRKLIAAGGSNDTIIDLLQAKDDEAVGIKNIQGNTLPGAEAMALTAVKFSYGQTADTITDPAQAIYSNGQNPSSEEGADAIVPFAILNGELEVRIGGTQVFNLPVKKFFRDGLSVAIATEGHYDVVELPIPRLIKGNQMITAKLKLAGELGDSVSHYVELRLMGSGIVLK